MPDYSLSPRLPLDGFTRDFGDISLTEVGGLSVVSLSIPLGCDDQLSEAVRLNYGVNIPNPGRSTVTGDGESRFLRLQPEQMFLLSNESPDTALKTVKAKLGDVGYFTDQSDGWVILRLSGINCRKALERVCMLDLSASVFAEGSLARTVMEHLSVIILREGEDSFLLMSARSSADSFLHAIQASI